jgi:hypothetical protein
MKNRFGRTRREDVSERLGEKVTVLHDDEEVDLPVAQCHLDRLPQADGCAVVVCVDVPGEPPAGVRSVFRREPSAKRRREKKIEGRRSRSVQHREELENGRRGKAREADLVVEG